MSEQDFERREPFEGEIWQHFKGRSYYIIASGAINATNGADSSEKYVVYTRDFYDYSDNEFGDTVYIRTLKEFMSEVDKEKYPDAEQKYRFEKLDDRDF
jgi:hypothetical protein